MPSPNSILESPGNGDEYWHVVLGPVPGAPNWHMQSSTTSYPFPTEKAAHAFARVHQIQEPGRVVTVSPPVVPHSN